MFEPELELVFELEPKTGRSDAGGLYRTFLTGPVWAFITFEGDFNDLKSKWAVLDDKPFFKYIDGSRAVYRISPNCSFPQISK